MSAVQPTPAVAATLFRLSIGVFFVGGFLSSVVSLFVPRMTLIYGLDYAHALMVQLAFHTSYLIFALPIAHVIMRIGYMRGAATGLVTMAVSCILLIWSNGLHSYGLLLASLLALSGGITFLQIAANTVVAVVGSGEGAAFRLNLLQAFNSIGTVIGPISAASFVLGGSGMRAPVAGWGLAPPFLFAIGLLVALSIGFVLQRRLLDAFRHKDATGSRFDWARLVVDRRLIAGVAAIFAYTGAEVAIGALLVNFLIQPTIFGVGAVAAAQLVSLYWGGAMIGRLAGAYAMRRFRPATMLLGVALSAVFLLMIAISADGAVGGCALLAIGLCNSIMYPTIYVLALPADPKLATPGATLLCMAVVGGAIVPMVTGLLADRFGLGISLALPALCYFSIAAFARQCRGANT